MLITTFEQWMHLPHNRGRRPADIYKEWLVEEKRLLMLYNSIELWQQWNEQNNNNAYGASTPEALTTGSVVTSSYFLYDGAGDSYMDPYVSGSTYFTL